MRTARSAKRGTVLVAVVVVVAMLSLGAYTLTHWMTVETDIAIVEGDRVQARLLAESGVEYVRALALANSLEDPTAQSGGGDDALRFRSLIVPAVDQASGGANFAGGSPGIGDDGDLLFTLFSMDLQAASIGAAIGGLSGAANQGVGAEAALPPGLQSGFEHEGGKINLNFWIRQDPFALREALLGLPNATPELVDAVLDWLDADDVTREQGAEAAEYAAEAIPRVPRNGPIPNLDELLQVRGMTPEVLYGEDANRNGLLDPNENDGLNSPPFDNEDGVLDRGWADYLTVFSRDSLMDSQGNAKINVNDPDLRRVYRRVRSEFGVELARFLIAYRLFGSAEMSGLSENAADFDDVNSVSPVSPPAESSFALEPPDELEYPPAGRLRSVLELVGSTATGSWNGRSVELSSPYQWEDEDLLDTLESLLDRLTVDSPEDRAGRLDLTSASPEAMALLTSLTEPQRESILDGRQALQNAVVSDGSPRTLVWLVREAIVEPMELVELAAVATLASPVVRFQAVGHLADRRRLARIEAAVDTETDPPAVVYWENLDRFGADGLEWIFDGPPRQIPAPMPASQGLTPQGAASP